MLSRISRFICGALSVLLASTALAQQKAAPELLTQKIDETQRITLSGTVSPALKRAADLGSLSSSQTLNRMVLVLKHTDAQEKDLKQLLAAQQQQGSAQYHQWLTPAQFQQRFSPAAADVAKVTGWLQSHGFTGVSVSKSGQRIEFSGPVASVESTFGTRMHQFSVNTQAGTEKHIANATAISIPQALSPVVAGLVSLNNFTSKPLHTKAVTARRAASATPNQSKPELTTTDGYGDFYYYLAPGDLRTIYGAQTLPASADGTGVSIAVIGRSNIFLSDVESFRTMFSLPQNDPNIIISGPDPGQTLSGDQEESSLDVEWAGAIAKNATVDFVIASSTDTTDGVSLAAAYAVENVVAPILTMSYGNCEQDLGPQGNLFWNEVWEQAAAEGMSVFVASGDGGAAACDADQGNTPAILGDSVNGISSTPYNVAVGGTEFADYPNYFQFWSPNNNSDFSSVLGYIPETTWNDSCDPTLPVGQGNCEWGQSYYMSAGGGGGRSNCATGTEDSFGNVTCQAGYPKPSWQQGPGVPADNVRDTPDVALAASGANDPYVICVASSCQFTQSGGQTSISAVGLVGGTSAASPVMASIMALVEQKNGTFVGLPNATLYRLAAQQATASCNASTRTDPTQNSSCVFNDITSGNNSVPGLPGWGTPTADFTSTTGYDLASGLGSVNIANLVTNWAAAATETATTTTLTATTTTAKHGTALPLSVAVTASTGTPTGDLVLLTDKYGAGDQYTLASDGTWSGSVSDLPGGTYSLTARYAGNNTFATSTSAGTTLTITPENSTATISTEICCSNTGTLTPVTTPNYMGYPIYFKGTVAGLSGQGEPTGTVTVLMDGTTNLGTTTLTPDGGYLLESSAATVGTHAITLQYAGDNSFNAVTSAPVSLAVSKGQSVTFMETGNSVLAVLLNVSGTITPTGTIQMFDNGVAVTAQLPVVYAGVLGSTPQVNIPYTFTAGVHTIYAIYSGDTNYLPTSLADGTAFESVLHVGSTGTTPSAISFSMTTASPLAMGQVENFIVHVSSLGSNTAVPTGYVSINIVGTQGAICSVILSAANNGTAPATCYANLPGNFTLQASYDGDSNYAPSLSTNQIALTVPKLTSTPVLTASAAYVAPNTQITLGATIAGVSFGTGNAQIASGTVTLMDSVNGAAATSLGTYPILNINGLIDGYNNRFVLPNGTNVLTAIYSGDQNFNPGTSANVTVVVGSPDFAFTTGQSSLTIAAGTTGSVALTIAPTLNYTGTVALTCGAGVPAGSTCSITPAAVTLGATQTATVSIATLAPAQTAVALVHPSTFGRSLQITSLAGLFLILLLPKTRRRIPAALLLLITASLAGCGGGSGSNSTPQTTLLAIHSSAIKTASAGSVTFTTTLSALENNPTGTVTFYDGATSLGAPATVSGGKATISTSSLAVGGHLITATYSGDTNNASSSSATLTQVITGTTTLQINATSGTLVHTISVPLTLN